MDSNYIPPPLSNQPGLIMAADTGQGMETLSTGVMTRPGGSNGAGFTNLLQARIGTFTTYNCTTIAITDSTGGTEAVEMTLSATDGALYCPVPTGSVRANEPIWIEFDIQASATSAITELYGMLKLDTAFGGGPGNFWRRRITPSTTWRPYRFLVDSSVAVNNIHLMFTLGLGASGTKVKIIS